ncbi:MAG TPA: hypothetical protein VLX61_13985 [Anaerolineales bacterium]|nr:hypothetical protein [Anaerolineales bacterium]
MRPGWLFLTVLALTVLPAVVLAQGATSPVITAPTAGQILRGQVSVTGTTDIANFASAELDFAYASDSTGTWFLLQTFSQPVANATLATWETTSIGDGDYILRLRVRLEDGSFQDATVRIRVQNETPLPLPPATLTPTMAQATATGAPEVISQPLTMTPIPTMVVASSTVTAAPLFFTPTALPPNPIQVQTNEIYADVQRGGLIIIVLFVFFGILIRLRRS